MNMTIEISFLFTNEDLKKKHNRFNGIIGKANIIILRINITRGLYTWLIDFIAIVYDIIKYSSLIDWEIAISPLIHK